MASQKTATEQVKQFYYDVIDSHRSVLEKLLENVKNNNWEGNVSPRKAKAVIDSTLDVIKEALEQEVAVQEPAIEKAINMPNGASESLDLMYNAIWNIDVAIYEAVTTYLMDERDKYISDIKQRPKGDPKKEQDLLLWKWCDAVLQQVIALTNPFSDVVKTQRKQIVEELFSQNKTNTRINRDEYDRG